MDLAHRAKAFFDTHARPAAPKGWGLGDDSIVGSGLASERSAGDAAATLDHAKRYQAALFDAGLAWPTGPVEYGGGGLTAVEHAQLRAVAKQYDHPDTSVFMIGQQIVAPAILACGTDDQKSRYLSKLFRGELVGCQLFSEPEAGSDLASLRCRAERIDGGWRITGQKVWSSGAHHADLGELLARTDDDPNSRNRGLTMFLVDMSDPAITVRPLRQMNGNAHFNEVFIDELVVGDDAVLGAVGGGWMVANASLSSERDLEPDDAGLFVEPVQRLVELAQRTGRTGRTDARIRHDLAVAVSRERIGRWMRTSLEQSGPSVAAVSASLIKLYEAQSIWQVAQLASRVAGPAVTADTGEWGRYAWSDVVLGAHSQRIAGGTDEIQRNIIGERGLGLPREPRLDG